MTVKTVLLRILIIVQYTMNLPLEDNELIIVHCTVHNELIIVQYVHNEIIIVQYTKNDYFTVHNQFFLSS